ncbi:hypothetical protein PR202_gb02442 [Eleusine coracana subsp. coracana]|uniref:Uncharacterized protein n=1 Tax=Eleusine coracana subsp. coracana TaxID=191504 RepID=A0AAV5DZ17_ELECO|nr:hypothetical protein PR202_gb02442 [Eleusine coracana subsp. coracana]
MDGSCKGTGGGAADNSIPDQNPSPNNPPPAATGDDDAAHAAAAEGRRPFTSLSQEEADLALARVLQEQERAYMMLTGQGGGEYAMLDAEGYDYEDDDYEEEDVSDYEEEEGEGEDEEVGDAEGDEVDLDLDPARYADDEAFARALQDAEERDVAGRLMALAGFGDCECTQQFFSKLHPLWVSFPPFEMFPYLRTSFCLPLPGRTTMGQDDDDEDDEEGDGDPQDAWEDVDPDEYSYEELVALGEVVGTESKGLSAETIASLPTVTYQAQDKQDGNMEQ